MKLRILDSAVRAHAVQQHHQQSTLLSKSRARMFADVVFEQSERVIIFSVRLARVRDEPCLQQLCPQ
jgi:hypothetical protein